MLPTRCPSGVKCRPGAAASRAVVIRYSSGSTSLDCCSVYQPIFPFKATFNLSPCW